VLSPGVTGLPVWGPRRIPQENLTLDSLSEPETAFLVNWRQILLRIAVLGRFSQQG